MKKLFQAIGVTILFSPLLFLMCIYGTFSVGFCVAKLWLWYAVPLGLPVIGWKVFGIGYQSLYLLRPAGHHDDPDHTRLAGILLAPWFVLLIGWFLL